MIVTCLLGFIFELTTRYNNPMAPLKFESGYWSVTGFVTLLPSTQSHPKALDWQRCSRGFVEGLRGISVCQISPLISWAITKRARLSRKMMTMNCHNWTLKIYSFWWGFWRRCIWISQLLWETRCLSNKATDFKSRHLHGVYTSTSF